MTINAVRLKIVIRDRQPPVVVAAMERKLQLDAAYDAMACPAQRSVCRRFEHLDLARRELALNAIFPFAAHPCASCKWSVARPGGGGSDRAPGHRLLCLRRSGRRKRRKKFQNVAPQ